MSAMSQRAGAIPDATTGRSDLEGRRLSTESKAAFKTTEFMAYLAVLAGIFIAGAVTKGGVDSAGAHHAGQDGSIKANRSEAPTPDQAAVAFVGVIGNLLHARLQSCGVMAAALLDARYAAGGGAIVKRFTLKTGARSAPRTSLPS